MAPNTQTQIAGPLRWPGLWAGNICSPRSLGLFKAVFLMRKGSPEARLLLLGFLPEGWCWILWSHLWLRGLTLLWGRLEKLRWVPDLEERGNLPEKQQQPSASRWLQAKEVTAQSRPGGQVELEQGGGGGGGSKPLGTYTVCSSPLLPTGLPLFGAIAQSSG